MSLFIGVLVIVFGLFFLSLGMLFIKYDLSPLKFIVRTEDVFVNPNFGIKIMIPGFILLYLSTIILTS